MKAFGKITLRAAALALLLANVMSLTSCVTLFTLVSKLTESEKSEDQLQTFDPNEELHSKYHELDLDSYVTKDFEYSEITISQADAVKLAEEKFLDIAMKDEDYEKYIDESLDEETRAIIRDAIILRNTEYKSYDHFFKDNYDGYLGELAFNACFERLKITPHEDSDYTEEGMATEFLFKDLGLTLTYGDLLRFSVIYRVETESSDIEFSEDGYSQSITVVRPGAGWSIFSDEMILNNERDMVGKALVEKVNIAE